MPDPFSITVSVLALAVSSVTAWLTLFRRGTVKMTQPTVIYFGPDTPRSRDETPLPKVYLRTLLFATSKRGRVVESMHVALSRNETHQNFNIWVYGDERLLRFLAKSQPSSRSQIVAYISTGGQTRRATCRISTSDHLFQMKIFLNCSI